MNTYGNPVYSFTPEAVKLVGEARLAYVRKVYSYFFLGMLSAIGGTLVAVQTDLAFSFSRSPLIGLLLFFGMFFIAAKSSSNPTRAVPTLGIFTFVTGLILAPLLYGIAHGYVQGSTVNTIYDALFLSGTVFAGLTAYTYLSRKDFSYMAASLTMGAFVLIGAMILRLFVDSSSLDMGISIIGIIIFSGFVLVDTSRILKRAHQIPPTLAALNLFLDFVNIFLFMLQLLTGGKGNRRS